MKRHGHLWPHVISFASLLRAADRARRGKRFRPAVVAFHFNLEHELWALHEELAAKTYRPGPYRTFHIHEPKKRLISAAPYRDRVVHHALCNVLEPVWERRFVLDSYACRKGSRTRDRPDTVGSADVDLLAADVELHGHVQFPDLRQRPQGREVAAVSPVDAPLVVLRQFQRH